MTPEAFLLSLSPLSSGTPEEHLLAIEVGGGTVEKIYLPKDEIPGVIQEATVSGVITKQDSIRGIISEEENEGQNTEEESLQGIITNEEIPGQWE